METNFSKVFALCRVYTTQSQFHLFFVLLGFIYNIYIRFQKHCILKKNIWNTYIYIYIYIYIYASPFLVKKCLFWMRKQMMYIFHGCLQIAMFLKTGILHTVISIHLPRQITHNFCNDEKKISTDYPHW